MKIVFICASLKENDSLSEKMIEHMIPMVRGHQYGVLKLGGEVNRHTAIQIMDMADAVIIVSPVSQGSVPSTLLGFLSDVELHMSERKALVSAVVHGNLFDSDDTLNALAVIEKWAEKAGLSFQSGLGVGACDALNLNENAFNNRHLTTGLANCVYGVIKREHHETVTISIGNRMVYRHMMENDFHNRMNENGIEPETLNKKIAKLFKN